jgi:hypothetical protein
MSRLIDPSDTPEPDAPYFDPFEEASLQIALAVGMRQPVTIDEIETLKQWCIQQIQEETL